MLYAPKFPLKFKEKKLFENIENTKELVRFHLTNLLLTNPGEKISDPNYGVGLRRYMFEQNLPSVRSSIASAISSQMSKYLPFLQVSDIQVSATAQEIDSNSLKIKIVYSIPGDVVQEIFELDLSPDNTIGFY